MNAKLAWGVAVCAMGLMSGGAQAQDYGSYLGAQHQLSHAAAIQRMGGNYHVNLHGDATATWYGYYATPGTGHCFGGHCPDECDEYGRCRHGLLGSACPHCLGGLGALHQHHHYYSYSQPAGLVYPPAYQPPAVVQYPYYTVKGPNCFFLDQD